MIATCIPAYNEEKTIAQVTMKAQRYSDLVMVCDDGSHDMTGEIAEKVGARVLRHQQNLGKGAALKTLFAEAKRLQADIVVTLDSDGQHNPNEIPKLLGPILSGEADIVNGSRMINGSDMPSYRRFGNSVLNWITNAASRNSSMTDTQSGFRAYSREAVSRLDVVEDGMGVDSQIVIDASRKGLRTVEVPVESDYEANTPNQNPFQHGLGVMVSIMKVVVEKSPLKYLGVPGLALILVGVGLMMHLLSLYNSSGYFSIPIALMVATATIIGLLLVITAVILWAIASVGRR